MIFLLWSITFAQPAEQQTTNNIESAATRLKNSLQELQIYLQVEEDQNIPTASILSKAKRITIQIENLQKHINQMDKQGK